MILILLVDQEKINYNVWFSQKKKDSNYSEVNIGVPTTNVAILIPENVDVPILKNIYSQISENADVSIPKNIHSQLQKMPISQFRKIIISLKHNFKKLILILWIMIPEHANNIWEYHVNQRDEIWRVYIKNVLHQPCLQKYNQSGKHNCSF